MRRVLLTAAGLLGLTGALAAADPMASTHDGDLAAIQLLPADYLEGIKASVKLVPLVRAPYTHDPRLAAFIVDYEPGGSAVLHRTPPASGYVLVRVLSGVIQAQAWGAGLGTYRKGQSWVFPAFAANITGKNASTEKPARALFVLVTDKDVPRDFEGDLSSIWSHDVAAALGR
jgi:quercetin dioxygenase-like cupin family protein